MNLCDYNTIRDLLARHGFHFSKSMGQNFLIDPEVPRRIAEASGADAGCGVLEIGPGIGPLTAELAQRSLQVRLLRQRRFYCCFRLWFHQCRFLLLAVRLWPVYLFICWPGAMGLILSE